MIVSAGLPWPLGVHVDADGANAAVFSANATRIELCLFDPTGTHETARIALPARSGDIHHGWRVGVPQPGTYVERLNTDSQHYGGGNVGTPLGRATSVASAAHGKPQSILIDLPPLATVIFEWTA